MTYLERMNQIIAAKKKEGLVGIKFCVLPESEKAAKDYELMAKAFCAIDDLRKDGTLDRTTKAVL